MLTLAFHLALTPIYSAAPPAYEAEKPDVIQFAQLSLKAETPKDPRVERAKRSIYDGYGRASELVFFVNARNSLGKNKTLVENEARDFIAQLGGSPTDTRANFSIKVESSNRYGNRAAFNEAITVSMTSKENVIAAYTAEIECGPDDQWTGTDWSKDGYPKYPVQCRLDKASIQEIFYRLADKVSGY